MLAYALLLLPLASTFLTYLFGRGEERRISSISLSVSFLTFLSSLFLLLSFIRYSSYEVSIWGFFTLRVDPLSVVMAIAVSGISLIVHKYSVRYMQDDEGYARFFSLLGLMTFSILLTVLAGDLLLLFTGWTAIGVILFFLLGHDVKNREAGRYAIWTFITQRLGDIFLFGAIVLLYREYGTFKFGELFERILSGGGEGLELVGLLIVLSAFAKSAQFPLHLWLPYTMGGPTPVSALMHAGIVNAGGFLINRFSPVFYHAEMGLHIAFWIGLATAILGSTLMLIQSDVKRALGYSTMGQMGYMIMECGLGAFALAIYHLIAHGIFKATLFMSSGSVIHNARKDPNIPEDEVYSFFVKRSLPATRVPWIVFALITVSVPLIVVVLAHSVAGVEIFKYQGAIILLFFGWITGAQTIFSIYKIGARSVYRLLFFTVLSFSVVVLGYVFLGHSFEKFLYPDKNFVERIYENASIHPTLFELQVFLLALVVVAGWVFVYYANQRKEVLLERLKVISSFIYVHLYRELYMRELVSLVGSFLERFSLKLNKLMRWV